MKTLLLAAIVTLSFSASVQAKNPPPPPPIIQAIQDFFAPLFGMPTSPHQH